MTEITCVKRVYLGRAYQAVYEAAVRVGKCSEIINCRGSEEEDQAFQPLAEVSKAEVYFRQFFTEDEAKALRKEVNDKLEAQSKAELPATFVSYPNSSLR